MRDTSPLKASGSGQAYRDASGTPTATAPALTQLAEAALGLLRSAVAAAEGNAWVRAMKARDGTRFELRCAGPDLPATLPAQTAHPAAIPRQRQWVGTYRLQVRAPLLVLDLYWNADEPLRIMQFSRGAWEADLLAMAP